jgi:hypothetical protein
MFMIGKQVTKANDQLHPIELQALYEQVRLNDGPLAEKVKQLRTLKAMQPEAYRRAKTGLPYIVSAFFQPAVRKKENFAWAQHFILDIDHIRTIGATPEQLKRRIQIDDQVLMCFVSPGEDGLKLVFGLKEKIHDSAYYSAFYKLFAARFAARYGLEGLIDIVTHDVSRCCFLSVDPDVYYYPTANAVDANAILPIDQAHGWRTAQLEIKEVIDTSSQAANLSSENRNSKNPVADDVLQGIKAALYPKIQSGAKNKPEIIQPAELDRMLPSLAVALDGVGLKLAKAIPIQYGRQLQISTGTTWCEINLFYGKRGYRAVKTTKTGSDPKLADLAFQAVEHFVQLPLNEIVDGKTEES